ncbi:hypothetical protein [Nitrosomonas halophila]|uniref:Proline-rich region n=1 Tax=Nitrosomonas halophila TaxID=44576 RepID=A0A1H3EEX8_9PROT|nr:hypothetical protein [Nitrosomonas halophila]SDX77175.1 hypothetical protein SAMN05421881_10088 [Nitrosomonas halophila]
MKKNGWFYLSLALMTMLWQDASWAGHTHNHRYQRANPGFAPGRIAGRPNPAFGTARRTSAFGYGGHYSYHTPNTRFFGSITYGRPAPFYRPYYRPIHRPYYRPFYDPFYWPAYPTTIYPPVYPPIVVVPATPPVYIQQPSVIQQAPPARVTSTINYWYYCENPAGYYPEVKSCPGGWIQVPPRPTQ